jgi:integrase
VSESRPRGSGSVFRPKYRADGEDRTADSWAIAYYDRRLGRQVREYGFETEAAAEKALRARLVDLSRGRRVGPTIEKVTFETLAKLIIADYRINKRKSAKRLDQSLKHLKLVFGGTRVVDIKGDRVTTYASSRLEEGAKPATVNRELAALKRMFSLGIEAAIISADTATRVKKLKENNVRQGFFEEEHFAAVLAQLEAPELRRAVTVAYFTGWRMPSEILTREWRHVDLKAGWLRLEPGETKNGRGRMFPIDLDPRLRKALEEAKAANEWLKEKKKRIVPWVFHRKGGERVSSFRDSWIEALAKAGLPGRIPHDFRRTAARNLIRRGYSERIVMELCGWETPSMFGRYFIADERMILEAVEADKRRQEGQRP